MDWSRLGAAATRTNEEQSEIYTTLTKMCVEMLHYDGLSPRYMEME